MLFKDVIGQEEAKQRLIAEVKEGRIPHAVPKVQESCLWQ